MNVKQFWEAAFQNLANKIPSFAEEHGAKIESLLNDLDHFFTICFEFSRKLRRYVNQDSIKLSTV